MTAVIVARRGERIVADPVMVKLQGRMHEQLDAIAAEPDPEISEPCS